jgi:hypothetical protein
MNLPTVIRSLLPLGPAFSLRPTDGERVSLIPSGTPIGQSAPEGWSALLLKSRPRAAYGDVESMNEMLRELSGMFFTAMLARIQREGDRPVLAEVAIGLGTSVAGKDIIVTPETQSKLGADLGLLPSFALSRGYERLEEVRVVGKTDNVVFLDAPVRMRIDNKNHPAVLRYAVCLEARSGEVSVLLWAIQQGPRGKYLRLIHKIEWLPANHEEDRLLYVDASEFSLGLPTEEAAAMTRLFQGREQFRFPSKALEATATAERLTAEDVRLLEATCLDFIASVQP